MAAPIPIPAFAPVLRPEEEDLETGEDVGEDVCEAAVPVSWDVVEEIVDVENDDDVVEVDWELVVELGSAALKTMNAVLDISPSWSENVSECGTNLNTHFAVFARSSSEILTFQLYVPSTVILRLSTTNY